MVVYHWRWRPRRVGAVKGRLANRVVRGLLSLGMWFVDREVWMVCLRLGDWRLRIASGCRRRCRVLRRVLVGVGQGPDELSTLTRHGRKHRGARLK